MKKNTIIAVCIISIAGLTVMSSCGNKRQPGKIYMPDMTYSRAMETYAPLDSLLFTTNQQDPGAKIFYNSKPVAGTISMRDSIYPYILPNDSLGYAQSAQVKNPLPPLRGTDSLEASRLYNINCAICHGATGEGNGPLSTSGKIGAIANLTLPVYVEMADGTMYHTINYGKNNMGSYAGQLSRKERWQMVQYIRALQPKPAGAGTGAGGATAQGPAAAAKDTATATTPPSKI